MKKDNVQKKSHLGGFFIFILIIAVIILAGHFAITSFFGVNGSIVPLGLEGYGDALDLITIARSDEPAVKIENSPSEENKTALISELRTKSGNIATPENVLMGEFVLGTLTYLTSAQISGGMLSYAYVWALSTAKTISTYSNLIDFDYEISVRSIQIKTINDNLNFEYLFSVTKDELIKIIEADEETAKILKSVIKSENIYLKLSFDTTLINNQIGEPQNVAISFNKSKPSECKKLVDFIEKSNDGFFSDLLEKNRLIINRLGKLSFENEKLIITSV